VPQTREPDHAEVAVGPRVPLTQSAKLLGKDRVRLPEFAVEVEGSGRRRNSDAALLSGPPVTAVTGVVAPPPRREASAISNAKQISTLMSNLLDLDPVVWSLASSSVGCCPWRAR
jgi:hypothetical protein